MKQETAKTILEARKQGRDEAKSFELKQARAEAREDAEIEYFLSRRAAIRSY